MSTCPLLFIPECLFNIKQSKIASYTYYKYINMLPAAIMSSFGTDHVKIRVFGLPRAIVVAVNKTNISIKQKIYETLKNNCLWFCEM